MKEKQIQEPICKSVFQNGENTTSKNQKKKKWIEMINRLEKNKGIAVGK